MSRTQRMPKVGNEKKLTSFTVAPDRKSRRSGTARGDTAKLQHLHIFIYRTPAFDFSIGRIRDGTYCNWANIFKLCLILIPTSLAIAKHSSAGASSQAIESEFLLSPALSTVVQVLSSCRHRATSQTRLHTRRQFQAPNMSRNRTAKNRILSHQSLTTTTDDSSSPPSQLELTSNSHCLSKSSLSSFVHSHPSGAQLEAATSSITTSTAPQHRNNISLSMSAPR